MRVRVHWMAVLRERIGEPVSIVELREPADIRDLIAALHRRWPELHRYWAHIRFATEDHYLNPDTELREEMDVYAIPPVSGGV